MSNIGSGTGSSYPTTLDTQSSLEIDSPASGKTKARAAVPNDLAAAVLAIQATLGARGNILGGYVMASKYASINAAVADAAGKTVLVTSAMPLAAGLTIPATTALSILYNGSIVKAGSYVLTINGPFAAGLHQVFSGFSAGDIVFGSLVDHVKAEWFGEVGDNSTDNTAARAVVFGTAIASAGRKVVYGPGTFIGNYSTDLALNPWSIVVEGQSPTATILKGKSGANVDVLGVNVGQTNPLYFPTYWVFRNITIDGNNANNTSGSVLNLFQCNLFRLDNAVLQNGAEWNLKVVDTIGVTQTGATPIWGNTVDASKGLGSVYIENSSDIDLGSVALQNFSQATQWPLHIYKSSGTTGPMNVLIDGLYLESDKNGIKINDATTGSTAQGMDVRINPTRLSGLGSGGGTLLDVTGDVNTRVTITGGNAFNSWDANWIKTTGTSTVKIYDTIGLVTGLIFQEDYAGYVATFGQPEVKNYIQNGNFEFWDTTIANSPATGLGMGFSIGAGGTYAKDSTNFKLGAYAWKYDNSGASADSETIYTFTQREINEVIGKYLNATIWVKGSAANASDLYITVTAGGATTYVSAKNHGTTWERLRTVAYIPTNVTAITVTSRVYDPYVATVDAWMASANYAGPFISKDDGLYGSIEIVVPAILTGASYTSAAIAVTGAAFRGEVAVRCSADLQGITATAYVSSAGNVKIQLFNGTAGTVTLGDTYWTVKAINN